MGFDENWHVATVKASKNVETIVRESAKKLFSKIILDTPIDTGELKGDWSASLLKPNTSPTGSLDLVGYTTIASVNSELASFQMGQTIFLSNTKQYAYTVEFGSSRQAPTGMLRVNAIRWSNIVNSTATEYKNK